MDRILIAKCNSSMELLSATFCRFPLKVGNNLCMTNMKSMFMFCFTNNAVVEFGNNTLKYFQFRYLQNFGSDRQLYSSMVFKRSMGT